MASLQVTLFGGVEARRGDVSLPLRTRKVQALLALLAAHPGERHSRQKLAGLLWGDTTDAIAANNLRQTLFTLRKTLGATAVVECDRSLSLSPDHISVDVADVDRLLADGSDGALRRAAELYRGELAEGLSVDEHAFDDWLRIERERRSAQMLTVLRQLLAAHRDGHDDAGAARLAAQSLSIDPLQEEVHRELMRIHIRQHRRADAIRQYERCAGALSELGTEPEHETTRLYRELMQTPAANDHVDPRASAAEQIDRLKALAETHIGAHAYDDAAAKLHLAMTMATQLPEGERDRRVPRLVIALANALYFMGRYADALELLLGERARVDRLDDPAVSGPYHFLVGRFYSLRGDRPRAQHHAGAAVTAAEQCHDRGTLGRAKFLLAYEGLWTGTLREAVQVGRESVQLLEENQEPWWAATASWVVGMNSAFLGDYPGAMRALQITADTGQALSDDHLSACAAWAMGYVQIRSGDADAGLASSRRALEMSHDHFNTSRALSILGLSHIARGEPGPAIATLERAIVFMKQSGTRQLESLFLTWMADAQRMNGAQDIARQFALDGIAAAVHSQFLIGEASARRALAEIERANGCSDEASAQANVAVAIFQSIGAAHEASQTEELLTAWTRAD